MSSNRHIRRVADVLMQRLDDEIVLLDAEHGHYYSLNPTGALVWEWLGDDGAPLGELRDRLVREFEVEAEVAETDLRDLIEALEREGLVRSSPSEGSG